MGRPKNKFREEARLRGEAQFFDNNPCIRGHIALRWVSNATCVECLNERNAKMCAESRAERAAQGRSLPKERAEARARGDHKYFTGRPCSKGHIAERYVRDAMCVECNREIQKAYMETWEPDLSKPCIHGHTSGRYLTTGECRECKKIKAGITNAKRKDAKVEWAREDRSKNPGKYRARVRTRQAKKLKATPPWSDLAKVQEIYEKCPEGCHVDHIIPLQGANVSGLHVPENLQYLPARENASKGNRFEPIYA